MFEGSKPRYIVLNDCVGQGNKTGLALFLLLMENTLALMENILAMNHAYVLPTKAQAWMSQTASGSLVVINQH